MTDSIQKGASSAASPLTTDLLASDHKPAAETLRADGNTIPAPDTQDFKKYYCPDYAKLEHEKMWSKVWHYVCREEDLPEVGDRYLYEYGPYSWFVVRGEDKKLRAFKNSCLHRGTKLCQSTGWSNTIRCPFHAWEWNLDGSLENIPSRWDFDHVSDEDYKLPELRLATWQGYVMCTENADAPELEKCLGVLPAHFESCPPETHYTAFHVHKKVKGNWKVCMEAFLEAYHVIETHPESLPFTGDSSSKYDIWDDGEAHISRLITPSVVPSPHLGDDASIADAANMAFGAFGMMTPDVPTPQFDPESPLGARAQVAEWRRQMMSMGLQKDFSDWSDSALIDSTQYFMFPNFCPWYGMGLPLVYQFLPLGEDPNVCQMNVRLMAPLPGGDLPKPPPAEIRHLDFDDAFSSMPEMGLLSMIFDQDMSNIPYVQEGLKSADRNKHFATFGRYQEQRIQHFHQVLDSMLKD